MPAHRCYTCGINFPHNYRKNAYTKSEDYDPRCDACGESLIEVYGNEDESYHALAVEAKKQLAMEEEGSVTYVMRTPLPVPNAPCDVTEHEGRMWIKHNDLLTAGYSCIEPFQVVRVMDRFYELQGHVGKHSTAIRGGAWWVEEIDPEDTKGILGSWPVLTGERKPPLGS